MENDLGIKAVLLTDGIIKEKDVESSSFSLIATYEECGNITIQENGELITITILKLFPSSSIEREPAFLYWGVCPSEINGTQFIKIYTFNEDPKLQNSITPIDTSCFTKVGDVYLSKINQNNNNRDTPYQIALSLICSTHDITLAYFFATWSGACTLQTPIVEAFVNNHSSELGYCKFDYDLGPEMVQAYTITTVPTCIFLDCNTLGLARITGIATSNNLELMYSVLTSE